LALALTIKNHLMKSIFSSFFVLLVLFSSINAQEKYKRKITVTEWVKEMLECKENTYSLENTEITFDYRKDTLYQASRDERETQDTINCFVEIQNCKLPTNSFALQGIFFKKYVFIYDSEAKNMNVYNCTFNEGIEILWGDMGMLLFSSTIFNDEFEVFESNMPMLSFSECTFNVKKQKARSNINLTKLDKDYKSIITISSPNDEKKIKIFQIDSCQINSDSLTPVINFNFAGFNLLSFTDTDFKNTIVNFSASSIEKEFTVIDCNFDQPIGMQGFSFPEKGTNFHWDQIKDVGIAIYNDGFKGTYTAETDSQLQEINKYNELVSSYKQMYSTYRTRGDMESANNCYIAMKDVETRRLAYLYKENRKLSQLL
jgi:hypothetical protein